MKRSNLFFSILFIVSILGMGCNKDSTNPVDSSGGTGSLTIQGWAAFEQRNFTQAGELFRKALVENDANTDAYTGLGWTYARMDSMRSSITHFDMALGLDTSLIDAYAGRSFVALALGKYREAITAVNEVQKLGRKFYVFRHDTAVSLNNLLLVKAQSSFFLRDYITTQAIIDQLDPENSLNSTDSNYLEQLAQEIEDLWSKI